MQLCSKNTNWFKSLVENYRIKKVIRNTVERKFREELEILKEIEKDLNKIMNIKTIFENEEIFSHLIKKYMICGYMFVFCPLVCFWLVLCSSLWKCVVIIYWICNQIRHIFWVLIHLGDKCVIRVFFPNQCRICYSLVYIAVLIYLFCMRCLGLSFQISLIIFWLCHSM